MSDGIRSQIVGISWSMPTDQCKQYWFLRGDYHAIFGPEETQPTTIVTYPAFRLFFVDMAPQIHKGKQKKRQDLGFNDPAALSIVTRNVYRTAIAFDIWEGSGEPQTGARVKFTFLCKPARMTALSETFATWFVFGRAYDILLATQTVHFSLQARPNDCPERHDSLLDLHSAELMIFY
jgi:hypothetical protein